MRAEVIAIGDELTSGQRLDTNSQWLSQRLGEFGVPVAYHTTVGDDLAANVAVFRNAIDRADLVIATGGLGPTADDLTREAIALAAGVNLVEDEAALAHIRALFARRRREMPERNRLQAQFPRGSRVVPNPEGTAPGIDLNVPRSCGPPCRVFALPGVPAEMVSMWEATVGPAIAASQPPGRVICHKRIKCFGVGESDLEAMLPDMIRRGREPLVGITVSGATITLRVTASGATAAACDKSMAPTIAQIRELLGVLVIGDEDDELEHAVVRLLKEGNQSLAVAECGTDGLISHWLTEAGGGEYFRGGIVAGVEAAIPVALGIDLSLNATPAASVSAIAQNIREKYRADWGLAAIASGELHVALASADNVRMKQFPLASHSAIRKAWSAKHALNVLRLELLRREA
jgi:nicotinamide-nucleotide amidase